MEKVIITPPNPRPMNGVSSRNNGSVKVLLMALCITLGFALIEVLGGILSGSLALLSDAGHMLTDVLALGLSLGASLMTTKRPTKRHTFGFHRIEILVALVNGITLAVLSIIIILEALERIGQPPKVDSSLMLFISVIGLGANLLGMYILREKTRENLNVKGAYLHMMGDLLSSIGVILAALLIFFFNLTIADPIISIVIGLVIIVGAYRLVNQSIIILLEAAPEHIDMEEVERVLMEIDGVERVHDIHAWTLTSGVYAMSLHIVVKDRPISTCNSIIFKANELLKERYQVTHSTIQIESEGEEKCVFPSS
jgi:cobalt-zinc-cadmium efflux system protein